MSTFGNSKNKLKQSKTHPAFVCLNLSFAFLVLTCLGCSNKLDSTPKIFRPHEIEFTTDNITLLWTLDDIDDYQHGDIINIAAAGGRLFLLVERESENASRPVKSVVTFDGQTGDLLWQMEHAYLRTITPTKDTLFAGINIQPGISPYISAYNAENGESLWRSQPIEGTKYVSRIREHAGLLYISTSRPSKYQVQDAHTGKVIHTVDFLWIVLDEREWKNVIPESEHEKFPDPINPDYFLSPQVPLGIWTREEMASERVIVTEDYSFGFTLEGKLEGRELGTGETQFVVQFIPNRFFISPYYDKLLAAIDEPEGLVYVWLGDSKQLFVFQIEYPNS